MSVTKIRTLYLKGIEIRSQISEKTPISGSLKSHLKLIEHVRLRYYGAKTDSIIYKKTKSPRYEVERRVTLHIIGCSNWNTATTCRFLTCTQPRADTRRICVTSFTCRLHYNTPRSEMNGNSGISSIPRINLSPFTKDFRGEVQQWVYRLISTTPHRGVFFIIVIIPIRPSSSTQRAVRPFCYSTWFLQKLVYRLIAEPLHGKFY